MALLYDAEDGGGTFRHPRGRHETTMENTVVATESDDIASIALEGMAARCWPSEK